MYSNDEKRINWLDVIIRILFGALFILIIVWLFPKVPNMKAFYSNVFRENIKYMQEAGESYFTNDRLPKETGDSVKLTLKEMQDKSLILPFVDKDGNSCNVYSSYVEVEKGENEYILKTNLVCNDEQNYINKVLGCYDYCENCNEEEEKVEKTGLQYQFKKAVKTSYNKYSCPKGYTLNGKTCYKNNTLTKDVVVTSKKVLDYSVGANIGFYQDRLVDIAASYNATTISNCPSGYTKTNDGKCSKTITAQSISNTTYTCVEGTQNGSTCILTTPIIKGTPYKANICTTTPGCINYVTVTPYSCPTGYTKSNNTCTKTVDATKVTTSQCPSGYNNINNVCSKTDVISMISTTIKNYYCPSGYNKIGSQENTRCTKYIDGSTYYFCENASSILNGNKCDFYKNVKQYSCDSDYKLNSKNICEKTIVEKIAATVTKVEGTSYQYKWNNSKTLKGWTYTGNIRTVKI